ncbi:MAG: sigma-54-dependent Fis family transcriptional regulator [Candidatus Didemnitutus sp.]|nr:sigma-54-dependent Fis family transcriptional regulator [Candidatus Didemnitutus sp.]
MRFGAILAGPGFSRRGLRSSGVSVRRRRLWSVAHAGDECGSPGKKGRRAHGARSAPRWTRGGLAEIPARAHSRVMAEEIDGASVTAPETGAAGGQLIGESEVMRRLRRAAEEIARSDVTVLIEGESGTGKELVARLIHERSVRAARPFIFVNCAALPEQLVEAELFGYRKGAFTDARADKLGRFQLADGGTLFLDEIGDLSPKGQGDLLRVLEDGAFRMVGGTELVRVDVRVVAATNKSLLEAVAAGKFREDLYYRLHVIPIAVPALRERAEDIPLLIEAFVVRFCAKHRRRAKRLAPEAMRLCQRFPWPGNIRQLRNVAERIVVTSSGPVIGVDELPDEIRAQENAGASVEIRAGMTIEEAEKLLIAQTIKHATANRAEAARLLGISRRALQYKLKRYGLLGPKAV